jgi:hypothetical protein
VFIANILSQILLAPPGSHIRPFERERVGGGAPLIPIHFEWSLDSRWVEILRERDRRHTEKRFPRDKDWRWRRKAERRNGGERESNQSGVLYE